MRLMTRRTFFGLLWAPWSSENPPAARCEYRASAQIRVFGIPLLSVQNVGGAHAAHERQGADAEVSHRLSFLAGSDPSRARGLNRLGFIRETICLDSVGILGAEYFGFMTASREESLAEAQAALKSPAESLAPFVAIEGRCDAGRYRAATATFLAPIPQHWSQSRHIEPLAIQACRKSAPVSQSAVSGPPITFLYSLMQVIHNPASHARYVFFYSHDLHSVEAGREVDVQAGRQLAARGLTSYPEKICRISCKVRNQNTGKLSSFTLWVEQGGACWLPLRFECRPKRYLSLIFDAVPGAGPESHPAGPVSRASTGGRLKQQAAPGPWLAQTGTPG